MEFDCKSYFEAARRSYIDLGFAKFHWEDTPAYRWMLATTFMDILGPELLRTGEIGKAEYTEGPYLTEAVDLAEGDLVVDVGANLGLFSALACSKGCRVLAFEPLPINVEYLVKLQQLNPKFDLNIVRKALSNYVGEANLFNHDRDLGGGTIMSEIVDQNQRAQPGRAMTTQLVEVTTLDQYYQENSITGCDFIKADIEGAEVAMIEGARKTIQEHKPKLSICTYHHVDDKAILKYLIHSIRPDYTIVEGKCKIYAY